MGEGRKVPLLKADEQKRGERERRRQNEEVKEKLRSGWTDVRTEGEPQCVGAVVSEMKMDG